MKHIFCCLRTFLLSLALFCLMTVSGPLHAWAQAKSQGNTDDNNYLEYTPKDFLESLEMESHIPLAEDEKETRQYNIILRTIPTQKYFVDKEPLQVIYEMYLPFNVSISNLDFRGKLKPFELVSLNTGGRASAPNLKNYEKQNIVLTVRLPGSNPYGIYKLPPLDISYEYGKTAGDKLETLKKVAVSKPVEFRKVPLFVELVQEHDICLIGDAVSFSIEIHADSSARVLNEYPPEGSGNNSAYLSEYRPAEPFVLLDVSREEALAESYRIIRWVYTVSPHDLKDEALSLIPPQVVWRQDGKSSALAESQSGPEKSIGVHSITPEALSLKVRSITEGYGALKPMKKIRRDPDHERFWLSTIPRTTAWVLFVSAAALVLAHIAQILRANKVQPLKLIDTEMPEGTRLDYDRWLFIRFLLKSHLQKAWEAFQVGPDKESCSELRSLLARRAVFRYRKKRISVQVACAMTASELRCLVDQVPEVGIISELDRQLETEQFAPLSGCGELDDVI